MVVIKIGGSLRSTIYIKKWINEIKKYSKGRGSYTIKEQNLNKYSDLIALQDLQCSNILMVFYFGKKN